jgi:hypothetical protein
MMKSSRLTVLALSFAALLLFQTEAHAAIITATWQGTAYGVIRYAAERRCGPGHIYL